MGDNVRRRGQGFALEDLRVDDFGEILDQSLEAQEERRRVFTYGRGAI
jgi:hypothetical protein